MTEYNPIFRSPIAAAEYDNPKSKIENLKLSDLTGIQAVLIQGDAGDTLQKQLSTPSVTPGDLVDAGDGVLACLTPKEFYLFGLTAQAKLPSPSDLNDKFSEADCFAHATDLTHGRAALKLSGSAAAEMLSKICGLDFHDSVFPNLQVKQTSAAKIKTFIARRDEGGSPVYHLHVNRTLGQYLWSIVWDAGQEFGIGLG